MATSLRCPECDSLLRLATAPGAGQKVRCPKCGTAFQPTAGAEDEPTAPRVASRSRAGDADDAPRARKSNPDRDDRDDRDDDERPRTRTSASRRSRSEDDDDDRPSRPRRKKQTQKQNGGLLIGLIAGGGVLLLLGAGGLVWALVGKKSDPQNDVAATPPAANTVPGDNSGPTNPANLRPQANPTNPNLVAAGGDLSRDLEEKTKRATTFIRVDVGGKTATGSGFILKANGDTGYIVTNFHVIAGPEDEPPPQANPGPPNGPGGPPGFPGRPPGFPGRPPGFPGRPPGFPGRPPSFRPPNFRPPGFPGGPGAGPAQSEPAKAKPRVTVILNSGTPEEQSISAEVVAVDDEADLATLRITGVRNLPAAIDMSQEAPVAETMPVFIFGFPGGVRVVDVKKGSISQLRRDQNNELNDVQINGEIIPGNSGGPVVDAQGRLVGIAVSTVRGKNVGFAIPTAQLNHMLKGCVRLGFVGQMKQQGTRIEMGGEVWQFDSKSRVRDRDVLQVPLGESTTKLDIAAEEYFVLARLADPMHKINSAAMHYTAVPPGTVFKPEAQGWAPLADAQKIPLQISDQNARGEFKLPPGAVRDQMYAFQVSYVTADGQTIFTHPHQVRLTFPKSSKTLTLGITTPPDDPSKRYIEDLLPKVFTGFAPKSTRVAGGLLVELDPVDDPQTIVEKIKFGEVVSVKGWTIAVVVKKVDLPSPDPEQVAKDLEDLKDAKRRIAAADRLAKVYTILPDRRVEVAKALEVMAADKDHFTRLAALRALNMWAGPENVAGLVRVLDTDDVHTRMGIVSIIAKYKDPVAADALAKLLPGLGERAAASAALKAIGPAAEKAVIPYLTHKDSWTAMEACNILKEIGTAESIPPLKTVLGKKPDFMVGPAATNALKSVESRKK
ncbi:MAG: trypsin-like serine protease with C-terminal domain [Gemmataceae bacterium]|nr:trypsin-like serine protease with C-terminal domain [Gemmataceae bacterium]